MNRRFFYQKMMIGLTLGMMGTPTAFARTSWRPSLIKPKYLKQGDTIGLITPGSYISDEGLQTAVSNLESLGFKVKLSKHIRAKNGFIAGTDTQRLEDFHNMFTDDSVKGIWCARGGYGCGRLLPQIDYKLIKKNPKVFIGYSDITALLQAIHCKTGLVCFHGPVGASTFTDYTVKHLQAMLMSPKTENNYKIEVAKTHQEQIDKAYQTTVIRPGKASGKLIGGNLSLLASLAGTDFQLNVKGKLLFIEDIGEKPYRIDRMLTQLRQSCKLETAAGIALGIFAGCEADEDDLSLSLMETLEGQLNDLNIPVIYGLSFGHIADQCTLPIGIEATLDTSEQTITLEELAIK